MTLRYFYIASLGIVAVICVYFNAAITTAILRRNARVLDAVGKKIPAARELHWAQGSLTRYVTPTILYGVAVVCGVAAYLFQLPPITHPR